MCCIHVNNVTTILILKIKAKDYCGRFWIAISHNYLWFYSAKEIWVVYVSTIVELHFLVTSLLLLNFSLVRFLICSYQQENKQIKVFKVTECHSSVIFTWNCSYWTKLEMVNQVKHKWWFFMWCFEFVHTGPS